MDELTVERFGAGVPVAEIYARPSHPARPKTGPVLAKLRRVELCGTADLTVNEQGGDQWRVRHERVLKVLRTWRG